MEVAEALSLKPVWILPLGLEQIWLLLELDLSPLPFPLQGSAGVFRGAQATGSRHP